MPTLDGWTGGGFCSLWSSPQRRPSAGVVVRRTRRAGRPRRAEARRSRTSLRSPRSPRSPTARRSPATLPTPWWWTGRSTRRSNASGRSTPAAPRPCSMPACTSWCSGASLSGRSAARPGVGGAGGLRRQHGGAVPGQRYGRLRAVGPGDAPQRGPPRRLRARGGGHPAGVPVEPRPAPRRRRRGPGPAGLIPPATAQPSGQVARVRQASCSYHDRRTSPTWTDVAVSGNSQCRTVARRRPAPRGRA